MEVEKFAEILAETLNGGCFQSKSWYNGDQKELWIERAKTIMNKLDDVAKLRK